MKLLHIYISIKRKWNLSQSNVMSSFILLNPVSLQQPTTALMLLITVSEAYLTSIAPQSPTP